MADTSYIQRLQAKRQQQTSSSHEQAKQDALIRALKDNQLAALLGNNKPPVILTDQTDLGDKIKELTGQMVSTIKGLDSSASDMAQLKALKGLSDGVEALQRSVDSYVSAIDRQTVQLIAALNRLELSPQITVPKPVVTVQERAIDFKPLEKALKGLQQPAARAVSLSDYRAHDLDDAPDGKQYIGFIDMDGNWYLMQSDDETHSLRYYFGRGSYADAWDSRFGHSYRTLSEARRGLAA